ncbi:MAG: CPBP family intramembrane metalloprotease [Lentisphaeria bacterium]|nr:CPBP family intramembrane metalloprotease [Lentisphaeria bacterium]
MIFRDFFKNNFQFAIFQWCAVLPAKWSLLTIVLYCCLNLFVPLCFSTLTLQLTIAPWGAMLLLAGFLYFSKNETSAICSFRHLDPGCAYKVFFSVLLILLLSIICYYWSCEFFKFVGLMVDEEQPLTESLRDASLPEIIIIGITTIIFAPIGEEIVFRRMLYGLLFPLGSVKALFLTSFLFSIAHFYLVGIPGLFFLAMILQLLYLHTRNLWCPILVHVIFNALSFVSVLSNSQ